MNGPVDHVVHQPPGVGSMVVVLIMRFDLFARSRGFVRYYSFLNHVSDEELSVLDNHREGPDVPLRSV